jgi:hypothetical protein
VNDERNPLIPEGLFQVREVEEDPFKARFFEKGVRNEISPEKVNFLSLVELISDTTGYERGAERFRNVRDIEKALVRRILLLKRYGKISRSLLPIGYLSIETNRTTRLNRTTTLRRESFGLVNTDYMVGRYFSPNIIHSDREVEPSLIL